MFLERQQVTNIFVRTPTVLQGFILGYELREVVDDTG